MSLHDEHLKQALEHAPDRDLAPNDAVRASVMTYADKAIKRQQVSWTSKISQWLHGWFGSSWQSVGLGSAVATLLIVVAVWHEQPDDKIWQVENPTESSVIREESIVSDNLPKAASVEKIKESAAAVPSPAPAPQASVAGVKLSAMPRKAKSGSPSSSSQLTTAARSVSDNNALADVAPQPAAPVVNLPEMPTVSAPAPAAQESTVTLSEKNELAKADTFAKKSIARPEAHGVALSKSATVAAEDILSRIKNEGGKVAANQDIQVGNFRLIAVLVQTKDAETFICSQLPSQPTKDVNTGYRVDSVTSCDVSESLKSEVEIYNQTMRDWHDKQQK